MVRLCQKFSRETWFDSLLPDKFELILQTGAKSNRNATDISTAEKKNIKKVIFQELNLIMTTEKTCQIQLTKLERWVKLIGTEIFTRFLVSFIYQQTRR